jgi:hypothetical protein
VLEVDLEAILSEAQRAVLEQLGVGLFLALKQVGELPQTLPEITTPQQRALREAALSFATQVLTAQASGALPVGVTIGPAGTRFSVPPRPDQRMISVGVVEQYLNAVIERWRKERDAGNQRAAAYVDAFQSARVSLLGELKP